MPLFTMGELLKQTVQVEYLLPPFLTKGGTMLLAAPLKSMKTFLGLHMATALASGKPFIDMPTSQARVLYIDYEIGIAEAKKRVFPMKEWYGSTENFLIRTSDETAISLDSGTVGSSNLFDLLNNIRPDVVFFDTLRQSTSGEENSSTDMMKVFTRLRELKLKFAMTAVVIHHMGKEPDERQTAPRTSRGSSVIEDAPDTIGYITKHVTNADEDPRISIRWKFRNHAPIEDSRFTYDRASGLFVRTPRKEKVKHAGTKHDEHITDTADDLSAGLLQTV